MRRSGTPSVVGVSYTHGSRLCFVVDCATIVIVAPSFFRCRPQCIQTNTRAIGIFVLVIQGNADLGPRLSESGVQNALDFCASLFNTFDQDVANDLRKHLEGLDNGQSSAQRVNRSALMDVIAPPLSAKEVQNVPEGPSFLPALEYCSVEEAEADLQRILEKIKMPVV